MKILVTGAAGFIGSYTSRRLIQEGHDVIGIDNFDSFYSRKAKELNIDITNISAKKPVDFFDVKEITPIFEQINSFSGNTQTTRTGNYEFCEVDITDYAKLIDIFQKHKIDAIVHLAAMAGVTSSIKDPRKYTHVNIDGTTNLLELSKLNKINNFVFASSSSVYGNCTDIPFKETLDVNFPISPYAATKRMGEIISYTYHYLHNINISCLRFFTVYGPLQRPYGMAIQKFIKQTYHDKPMTVYGDGTMARDFTYIDDIVDGIFRTIVRNQGYNVYNLGNTNPVSLNILTKKIKDIMGKGSVEYFECPPTEVNITCANIENAKSEIDYSPKTSFDEGLKKQIDTFISMPEWYKNLED